MRLLLTSAGITNPSIRAALDALLPKPVEECAALAVPTAQWAHPRCGPVAVQRFLTAQTGLPMVDLGWRSVGVLELTALPSLGRDTWLPWVEEADVLLAAGGDALYLAHWLRECGLADLLPSLVDTVWVGLSAGSMALTPCVGEDFVQWRPPSGRDEGLGLVDFSICPHLAPDGEPGNSLEEALDWAARVPGRAYAVDDQTAFSVVDGVVEVVSEGRWELLRA